MIVRTLVALVAGLLLSIAFEPVALPVVVPVALAAFALTTRDLPARRAWLPGAAFGVGFYFTHIWWMNSSIGAPAWLALSALETSFYAALGAASPSLQRLRWWPAWLAAGWVTMEVVRTDWPWSGMPWGRLAYGVADTPFAPALAYVGMNGVGFVLALIGFLLAQAVIGTDVRSRLVPGAVLVGVVVVAVLPVAVPFRLETTGTAVVAVVQGDVPGRANDVLYDYRGVTANHVQATIDLAEAVDAGEVPAPDFVVWPENSTAVDPFADAETRAGIESAVSAIGVPVMVGAIVDAGPDQVLNQGIVWDPETGAGERYSKRHPVAFGEYIPLRGLIRRLGIEDSGQLGRIPRDMRNGVREEPLDVGGIEVADAICFDVAYDDGFYRQVRNGAELLAVQTSNASFIFTDQVDQQFAITRLRAVEAGRSLAVASTNGIAGIVDRDGEVLDRTQRQTTDVLIEEVPLMTGVTPGIWVGGGLRWLLPGLTLLGLALRTLTYRREREPGPRPAEQAADPERAGAGR